MLDLLRQFEEDCAEDDQKMRHAEETANLASRLEGVDLGMECSRIILVYSALILILLVLFIIQRC